MFIHCCAGDVRVRVRKTIVQTDGDGRAGAHCEYNLAIHITVVPSLLEDTGTKVTNGHIMVMIFETVVLDLLAEAMITAIDEHKAGYLLDAFPLNLDQAAAFEAFIGPPSKVIYLSLAQVCVVLSLSRIKA